jgi:hypothetical protein
VISIIVDFVVIETSTCTKMSTWGKKINSQQSHHIIYAGEVAFSENGLHNFTIREDNVQVSRPGISLFLKQHLKEI